MPSLSYRFGVRTSVGAIICALLSTPSWAAPTPSDAATDPVAVSAPPVVRLELAIFPMVLEQQIEGPNRDDKLTQDLGLSTQISAMWIPHPNVEVGALFQMDAGRILRSQYGLVGPDGTAELRESVAGSWWELWTVLLVRGRLGPIFAEVGWAPLILRSDEVRTDLANTQGSTSGLFVGSRAVAWLLGAGGAVELGDNWQLTVRIQFRIRYLVERDGAPLAADEETGQMTVWPFIGVSYAL